MEWMEGSIKSGTRLGTAYSIRGGCAELRATISKDLFFGILFSVGGSIFLCLISLFLITLVNNRKQTQQTNLNELSFVVGSECEWIGTEVGGEDGGEGRHLVGAAGRADMIGDLLETT